MSIYTPPRTEIAIFDSRVDDLHVLLNGLKPGIEAYVLHPEEDGIAQISTILAAHRDVKALHIISHGASGQILIGKSTVTTDSLRGGDITLWRQALSANAAEILIYGCNVASGELGAKLIATLDQLTGAKVAASESLTGQTEQGGNWELEVTTAPMQPVLALQPETLNNYRYIFGTPPSLSVTDTTNYSSSPVIVAPNLTISDPDGETLTGAKVSIGSQFDSTQDRLGLSGQVGTSGTVSGLSWNYNTTTGVMTLSGSADFTTYQSVLRQITYSNTSATPNINPRSVQFTLGSNLANPDNGHFYEFVSSSQISWTNARNAAASRSLFGLQGYLATITSATENNFIASKIQGEGWIGANDATTEGVWRWETGPEAGTQFWQGTSSGSSVGGRYSNWDTGEPNDASSVGGEDYAHLLADFGRVGKWNDYPLSFSGIAGYVVEYGGMPGDPTLNITGTATVRFGSTIQFSTATYSAAENVGTSNAVTLTRTGDTSQPASAIVSITGGTATGGGTDYTSSAFPLTINFAANETSKTVALPINNDTLFEGNETINLSLAAGTNAILGTQTTTAFTITDNDIDYAITSSANLTEGNSGSQTASFTITRSGDISGSSTVNFALGGTATVASDYTVTGITGVDVSESGGTITFNPGATEAILELAVLGDLSFESNETINMTLSGATAPHTATLTNSPASITITNDDAAPPKPPTPQPPTSGGGETPEVPGGNTGGSGSNGNGGSGSGNGGSNSANNNGNDSEDDSSNTSNSSTGSSRGTLIVDPHCLFPTDFDPTDLVPPINPISMDEANAATNASDNAEVIQLTDADDLLIMLAGDDVIISKLGNDIIGGNQGNDRIDTSDGNDLVVAGKDQDTVTGGSGDDILSGELGRDLLYGEAGNDIIFGGQNEDVASGNQGEDSIAGGKDSDLLDGNEGNDFLFGNTGRDLIDGGEDNDWLYGGQDDDTLVGASGNDVLLGDIGNDCLHGGEGADTFILNIGHGSDIIADFTVGEDKMGLLAGLEAANLQFVNSNGSTTVSFNGELLATVQGVTNLSLTDFLAL